MTLKGRSRTRHLVSVAFTATLLVLTGCSHFNRDWQRASKRTDPTNAIEGRWEGTWQSDADHHHGKLQCLMTAETNSIYQARFQATFAGILKFHYTAQFKMQPHGAIGWEFNGEANLGKFGGGTYYYEGRATGTNLSSIYRSKYDRGTFDLHRP